MHSANKFSRDRINTNKYVVTYTYYSMTANKNIFYNFEIIYIIIQYH